MIVAYFAKRTPTHDCWGKSEWYTTKEVKEFKDIDAWLKFRTTNDVTALSVYEVSKKIL